MTGGHETWNPRFPNTYDFVCSMGHYCGTASYLRRHHLRRASGPLDWNGESPAGLPGTVEIICTDFKDFLRFENLTKLEHPTGEHDDMSNEYCRDEGTGNVFYHDFAYGVPLSETYPEVRRTYDRRIARFYGMVSAARRTLLIFHTIHDHPGPEGTVQALSRLRGRLGDRVDLLVIEHEEGAASPAFREVTPGAYYAKGHFFRAEVHWLLGDHTVLDRLYGAIPLRHKRLLRLKRMLGRLFASLHLSREARHRARRRAVEKD